jgi:glucose-6-phosphate-specific signal transduction histidine kinase
MGQAGRSFDDELIGLFELSHDAFCISGFDGLHLLIRDDGTGGAGTAKGSGLVGLNDRVEALGGTMTISSQPGNGTSLHVEIPLEIH